MRSCFCCRHYKNERCNLKEIKVAPKCYCLDFIEDGYKNNLINLLIDNLEFNSIMKNGVSKIEISLFGKYIKTI